MASVFLEPGGDAEFGLGLWSSTNGPPSIVTDFVHGGHVKSIRMRPGATFDLVRSSGFVDAGGRVSFWIYLAALPIGTGYFCGLFQSGGSAIAYLYITNTGVLTLASDNGQIGSNGSTLSTGVWYRITFTWKITSTTVNRFEIFLNGVSNISGTNTTLPQVTTANFTIGNDGGDANLDFRLSDFYGDDSNALTDPGNVWVTAKRDFANGTTNGMTGSGTPSGYGSGNARYVNERPNSDSNFVSVVGAGSPITEEYNIESVSQGDIDITGATIVDYMGWVRAKALASETGQIIVNGASSNIALTSTTTFFTKIAGSATYPAGTGTDIGIITSTAITTVSLYECGILFAYIPAVANTVKLGTSRLLTGVGS